MREDFDAFLELKGGKVPVVGETVDEEFGGTGAIELDSFGFGGIRNLARDFAPKDDAPGTTMQPSVWGWDDDPDDAEGDAPKEVQHFSIEKPVDNASPNLFQAYCSSSLAPPDRLSYTEAIVSLRKPIAQTPTVYIRMTFTNVYVTEYDFSTSDEGPPIETITFSFRKVKFEYYPQTQTNTKGSAVTGEWDFAMVD